MEQTRYFNIEADNEDQVRDWLNTHSMEDIKESALTNSYADEWDERIVDVVNVGDYDTHISLKRR